MSVVTVGVVSVLVSVLIAVPVGVLAGRLFDLIWPTDDDEARR